MLPLLRPISRPSLSLAIRHTPIKTLATAFSGAGAGSGPKGPPLAVFWDLDNMPPISTPPYVAATRLRLAAFSFGHLRFIAAHATPQTLRRIPSVSSPLPAAPQPCRVCGRNFFSHSTLLNHFKIHEREHAKRLSRINSAVGGRYVRLKAKLDMKLESYRRAAREILIPSVGYTLGDELGRAGVSIRIVEAQPRRALAEHMMEAIGGRRIGCLVLVSSNVGFAGVVREAKARGLRTVVVGDDGDGSLKRCADSSFSWRDVVSGRAREEAGSAVVKWKDKDLLKKLEWRNQHELERKEGKEKGSELEDMDLGKERSSDRVEDLNANGVSKPWWKLN